MCLRESLSLCDNGRITPPHTLIFWRTSQWVPKVMRGIAAKTQSKTVWRGDWSRCKGKARLFPESFMVQIGGCSESSLSWKHFHYSPRGEGVQWSMSSIVSDDNGIREGLLWAMQIMMHLHLPLWAFSLSLNSKAGVKILLPMRTLRFNKIK